MAGPLGDFRTVTRFVVDPDHRLGVGCTSSIVLRPLMVRVRRSWMICAAPGKSIQSGACTALMVRRTRRPWPGSVVVTAGTSRQGRALDAARRVGWRFHGEDVVGVPAGDV